MIEYRLTEQMMIKFRLTTYGVDHIALKCRENEDIYEDRMS